MADVVLYSAESSHRIHSGLILPDDSANLSNPNQRFRTTIRLSDERMTENPMKTDTFKCNDNQYSSQCNFVLPVHYESDGHFSRTILIEHNPGASNNQKSIQILDGKQNLRLSNEDSLHQTTSSSMKETTSDSHYIEHENENNSIADEQRDHRHPSTNASILLFDGKTGRRSSNAEQHYDYPADVIQRLRQQNDRVESGSSRVPTHLFTSTATSCLTPSIVPFNALKRMDHLNTIFIKPTRIERPLPKLVFQDNDNDECSSQVEEKSESKVCETSLLDESDPPQQESELSSLIFYEQTGLAILDDDQQKQGRHVRFSTAPIRVYPTYSASEYDRRNEDIDPFSASAEYELEKRIEKMDVFRVDIQKGSEGLGMSVLGMGVGADSGIEKLGIFVKSLNPDGVIAKDGRIQIGDQIIEVNEHYMVGVTHMFATQVLKSTSGSISFLVGREKDAENSEVIRLIRRSLQMDQERFNDSTINSSMHPEAMKNQREFNKSAMPNEYEMEILKECFESLEKTLESVEKEKDYYQQLYQETSKDLHELEEKYKKAMELIKEFEDRETKNNEEQMEKQKEQQKKIQDLIRKIEKLEQVIGQASQVSENNAFDLKLKNKLSTRSSITLPTKSETEPFITTPDVQILDQTETRSRKIQRNQNLSHPRSISVNSKLDQSDENRNLICRQISWNEVPSLYSSPTQEYSIRNESIVVSIPLTESQSKIVDTSMENEYVEVKDWNSDRCVQWLTNERFESLIPLFLDRNITGEKLLSLDSTKMKTMGIKSSKDRDRLKSKLKELKQTDLIEIRERFLSKPTTRFERVLTQGKRFRSSSLNKLKDRHFFTTSTGNCAKK